MTPEEQIKPTRFFKIALFFFSPYKWKMLFLASIMFIESLLETLNLLALYPLVNYGLEQQSEGKILEFIDQLIIFSQTDNPFMFYCYILMIITVIAASFKFFTNFISFNLYRNISKFMYKVIFEKFLTVDYNFFVNNQPTTATRT